MTFPNSPYMPRSPKSREIIEVEGDASTIRSRGTQITTLGNQMVLSADVLADIANGATGEKGLAIEKLRDKVGDCYEELRLAGQRYQPTGPVLVTYADVLAEVQPLIKTAVANCESEWKTYQTKLGSVESTTLGGFDDPANWSEERKQEFPDRYEQWETAHGAAETAKGEFDDAAEVFDGHYDTWAKAFDKAASDIGTATDGGISDSRWDDLDGFVSAALTVLQWVGLALAVLGLIIGGPFIAALAAIVAIATLILTLYSFARGNSTLTDLIFAVIGVIPFGSLGKGVGGFFDGMVGGLASQAGRAGIAADLAAFSGGFRGAMQGGIPGLRQLTGIFEGGQAIAALNNFSGANVISRLFTGKTMQELGEFGTSSIGQQAAGILGATWGDGFVKNIFGSVDNLIGLTTGTDPHDVMFPSFELDTPWIGANAPAGSW